MPTINVNLGQRSNPGRFGPDSAARLVNCYAEDAGAEGKVEFPIYPFSGWTSFATLTGGAGIRAALKLDEDTYYVVSGQKVFKVTSLGAVTSLGIVGSASTVGLVTMVRNRAATPQIGILVDALYYTIASDVLTPYDLAAKPIVGAVSIAVLDGYFVLFTESGSYYLTAVDNATSINVADTAKCESSPDKGVTNIALNRSMVFFSERSIEFWDNTGGAFPFTRTATRNVGCYAGGSVAEVSETLAFIAHDQTVRMLSGYDAQIISTPAVERSIVAESDVTLIRATSWTEAGHSFYQISGTGFTWVYDTKTGFWTERRSVDLDRSRVSVAINTKTRLILGDYASATLYQSSQSDYAEAGDDIIMQVVIPVMHQFPASYAHEETDIDVMTGVGLNSTSPELSNPQLMLDYSDDGGVHFRNERQLDLGVEADRLRRVRAFRLGRSGPKGRNYRIRVSASVARCLMGMAIKVRDLGI